MTIGGIGSQVSLSNNERLLINVQRGGELPSSFEKAC